VVIGTFAAMERILRISAFFLSSLVYFPTIGHTCTLNIDGVVSDEVTPGELGHIKLIRIDISKCTKATGRSSCRHVYKTSIPKVPIALPTVFSNPVIFPGGCPAIVRIEVSGLDMSAASFDGPPLYGSTELHTKETLGNDITVRMIPEPTF
jgi:hypothetical protein